MPTRQGRDATDSPAPSSWGRRRSLLALSKLKPSSSPSSSDAALSSASSASTSTAAALAAANAATSAASRPVRDDGHNHKATRSAIPPAMKMKHARTLSFLNDPQHTPSSRPSSSHLPVSPSELANDPVQLQHRRSEHDSRPARPTLTTKFGKSRQQSMFTSLRTSFRSNADDSGSLSVEPQSASSYAPSPRSNVGSLGSNHYIPSDGAVSGSPPTNIPRTILLLHGEVQTSAGMFRKKKEYLVLTDTALLRFKSQGKAAEVFRSISANSNGRSPLPRHGSVPSVGSFSELQTLSDMSSLNGDQDGSFGNSNKISLRHVVAVHKLDDGKPYFALELCFFDDNTAHAASMALQFSHAEERDTWLQALRSALPPTLEPVAPANLEAIARIVERARDYDPANCAIFKVAQRQTSSKSHNRSATTANASMSDDGPKSASTICYLVFGVHKVHLITIAKPVTSSTSSSPASISAAGLSASVDAQASFGILTLSGVHMSSIDDEFELTFRAPLQRPRTLYLASAVASEIICQLQAAEAYLRPECCHRLYAWDVPPAIDDLLAPRPLSDVEEHSCLDRTLSAYCVAYGVNPASIRYAIDLDCEDAPRFTLLPPATVDVRGRTQSYSVPALLAIFRALRYNESFGAMSFAGIPLDGLHKLHETYGREMICNRTKRGSPIRLTPEELAQASVLVQEIRALAVLSKKLRFLDFSGCGSASSLGTKTPASSPEDEMAPATDRGCGIVEALVPLCKHQTTNVDWICLNGIQLSETDLDYLVDAAVDKSCHFRALELNQCGLGDRSLALVLDALRYQENTLEALELAGNVARLSPASFDSQLGVFAFIRRLNLAHVSVTANAEALLQPETLLIWRLQELRFTGTTLNDATVDAVAAYLAHPQSSALRQLAVDNTYIDGSSVATLLHSLSISSGAPRDLHLDISQSLLNKDGDLVVAAIAESRTPAQLSMRAIEFRDETLFRKVILAFAQNKTTRYLDISQAGLSHDASEETCNALQHFFKENKTVVELDLSGDDSRLAASKFGPGLHSALASGLAVNTTLQVLRVQKQRLGLTGAIALSEVLRKNVGLTEIHCDQNEIPLHGLTELVDALEMNRQLLFLPTMEDGRAAALKSAERVMIELGGEVIGGGGHAGHKKTESNISGSIGKLAALQPASVMRRGINSVRRTAARSGSPSLPATRGGGPSSIAEYASPSSPRGAAASAAVAATGGSPLSLRSRTGLSTAAGPPDSPTSNRSPISTRPSTSSGGMSAQDIQSTHLLLTEQWDRQCARLQSYLRRNWNLAQGFVEGELITDAASDESDTYIRANDAWRHAMEATGRMVEQDLTPRPSGHSGLVDRQGYFDSPVDSGIATAAASTTELRKGDAGLQIRKDSKKIGGDEGYQSSDDEEDLLRDAAAATMPRSVKAAPFAAAAGAKAMNSSQVSFKQFLISTTPPTGTRAS